MTTATELTELADLIELGKRDFKALTQQQEEDLLSEAARLKYDVGDEDRAEEIYRLFPVSAELVKGIKDSFGKQGAEMLKRINYNYSEAETLYGKDWLNQCTDT